MTAAHPLPGDILPSPYERRRNEYAEADYQAMVRLLEDRITTNGEQLHAFFAAQLGAWNDIITGGALAALDPDALGSSLLSAVETGLDIAGALPLPPAAGAVLGVVSIVTNALQDAIREQQLENRRRTLSAAFDHAEGMSRAGRGVLPSAMVQVMDYSLHLNELKNQGALHLFRLPPLFRGETDRSRVRARILAALLPSLTTAEPLPFDRIPFDEIPGWDWLPEAHPVLAVAGGILGRDASPLAAPPIVAPGLNVRAELQPLEGMDPAIWQTWARETPLTEQFARRMVLAWLDRHGLRPAAGFDPGTFERGFLVADVTNLHAFMSADVGLLPLLRRLRISGEAPLGARIEWAWATLLNVRVPVSPGVIEVWDTRSGEQLYPVAAASRSPA